jgi:hypothetical protein
MREVAPKFRDFGGTFRLASSECYEMKRHRDGPPVRRKGACQGKKPRYLLCLGLLAFNVDTNCAAAAGTGTVPESTMSFAGIFFA